jgi:hypothetical protein
VPDRLATQLLRVARAPASGRLNNPGPLASGWRAALFTDLILTGRLRAPRGGSGPSLLRRHWHPLIEAAARTGEPGADVLPEMLFGASKLLRRPLRRGG